jgi:hypothetical protein
MTEQHRPGHGNTIVLGVAAVILIVLIVLFAPLVECPICRIGFIVEQGEQSTPSPRRYWFGRGCDFCWKGRISAYTRWLDPHSPFPGSHFTAP